MPQDNFLPIKSCFFCFKNYRNKHMCKDTKIRGLNPLKVVRPTPPNQAQTDKYLLRKWGKQVGLKSKDSNRNERKLKTNSINGSFQARLRTMFLHKDTHCCLSLSLSSYCSCSNIFIFFSGSLHLEVLFFYILLYFLHLNLPSAILQVLLRTLVILDSC